MDNSPVTICGYLCRNAGHGVLLVEGHGLMTIQAFEKLCKIPQRIQDIEIDRSLIRKIAGEVFTDTWQSSKLQ